MLLKPSVLTSLAAHRISLVLSLKKKQSRNIKMSIYIFFVKNTGFERESTTSWFAVYACAVLLAFPKISRRFAALCAISLLLKSLQDFNNLGCAYCSLVLLRKTTSLWENLVLRSKTYNKHSLL